MAVAHNALMARRGPEIGMLCEKLGNLRLHLLRDKQDENTYCLTGECSRDVKRCLTQRAPVASLILRPSRSFFSDLQN
jgi:hypothetical protein